jgi:hypothetical protein
MITASLTHGNGSVGECTYCHVSTDTDGSLVNGATGTASNDVGDAQLHTWGTTSSCAKCHENGGSYTYSSDFASHIVQDHDGVTGTTNSEPIKDCNNCHTGDIIRVVHNTPDCVDCHVNSTTNGELVGAGINGWGTTVGHSIGATSNCLDCHEDGSTYTYGTDFETHVYGSSTDHDPSGSGSTLNMQPGDLLGGSQPCSGCHVGTLDNFGDVYTTHDKDTNGPGACATCHNSTRILYTDSTGVQDIIHANETTNSCVGCHTNKTTSHGGHAEGHFAFDSNCDDCHATTNNYVVQEVHYGTCTMCHSDSLGSTENEDLGSTTFGIDGDAGLANGDTSFTSTCTTCHPINGTAQVNTLVEAHHDESKNSYAPNGECHNCHTDPRTAAGNVEYQQLACRECHVDTSSGVEIMHISLKGGLISGANATQSGNVKSTISAASHQFPNTASIDNYGACFYCHGNTDPGNSGAPLVVPWHALPEQSIRRADLGTVDVVDTNLMGGGGWQIDETASPAWPATEFQGANPSFFTGTGWTTAYYPAGKEVLNIAWSLISTTKKAAKGTGYQENRAGLITNSGWNIPSGLNMGTAFIPHDSNNRHTLVHFDDTPGTLGVDTVTGSATDSYNCGTGATGPCGGARDIVVSASSTDGSAQLTVIYGGQPVHTGTTPLTNVTIDIQAEAVSRAGDNHTFASGGPGVIFVVSDKGGSTKIISSSTTGQGAN